MKAGVAVAVAAALAAGASVLPERWFQDVTASAGIDNRHTNRAFDNPYAHIMAGYTALGASAAVADYDDDGLEDVFVTDSKEDGKSSLYRNNGDFTFTDVAEFAGVADGNDSENAAADSLWFDFNNDGRPDLLVVRFGRAQLYENLGGGPGKTKFREVAKKAGIDQYRNGITAIAFDADRDGFVDLFIGSYFQAVNVFNPETPRFFPESFETANNGGGVVYFHNNGDGTFTDLTEKAGLKLSGWTLDLGHGDADNDGDEDLYVAADFGTDRFFVNNGDGTFKDITETAIGFDTKKGMNVDWGDFDNDGYLDIYVTNITDDYMREGNFLWKNNGNLTFHDISRETGTHNTGWGWGAKFFDYDNDGWLDLYVMNGWVSAGKDSYVPDIFAMVTQPGIDFADARNWPPMGNKSLSGYQKKRLFHNERGQLFKDEAARHGLDSVRDGRGVAIADFDNDGRLDIFVANANERPYLYRNTAPNGAHWISFLLTGRKSNRRAVGAQVRLAAGGKTYLRYVSGGNSFAGQSSSRVHFGLAESAGIEKVEIRWPSGETQTLGKLAINRIHKIVEGESKVTHLTAKANKR
ncbi:MAG: CRTAC1 family protein [Bryobacteraceae bacterium]